MFSELSERDQGWVVGILEGEGCFDTKGKRARVRVSMSDDDVVKRFTELLPTHYSPRQTDGNGVHKDMFHYEITGKKAKLLMTDVFPYMSERRQLKIQEVLLDA